MTSDAKIGLLLGLVFIFVIAFIINGLPNFGDRSKAEATPMVNFQTDNIDVVANARSAQEQLDWKGLLDQEGDDLVAAHKATAYTVIENSLNGMPIPLHKGSVKYLKEMGVEVPEKLIAD